MKDTTAYGALFAKDHKLCHQIMFNLCFNLKCSLDVNVADVQVNISQLLICDQSSKALRLGQCQPYPTPQPPLIVLAPYLTHHLTTIAIGKWGEIGVERMGITLHDSTQKSLAFLDLLKCMQLGPY